MKREIKFRAWDASTNTMTYQMPNSAWFDKNVNTDNYIGQTVTLNTVLRSATLVAMQFTGIEDKNGKAIYEGDIISAPDIERAEIRYSSDSACYMMGIEPDWSEYLHWVDADKIEVLGNIYEHPHLLTVKS